MRNFRIDWVIEQDLPDYKRKVTATGFKMECPFCHKKWKMDVNISKGLCRCNACGNGFNALTLHSTLCEISPKEAYKDLWKRYNGLSSDVKAKVDKPVDTYHQEPPLKLWIRSLIYREFLGKLELKSEHRENLLKRGLSEKQIELNAYKSVPEQDMDCSDILYNVMIRDDVRKELKGKKKIKLAGFEWKGDRFIAQARKSGILIPIIVKRPLDRYAYFNHEETQDEDLISGFQIRFDEGKRYSYYAAEGQFTGYESIHYRLPDSWIDPNTMEFGQPECRTVILTEGGLKADVASCLSNDTPFIAVMGVNNQKYLKDAVEMLKERYSTEEIVLAFDEDYVDNQNVAAALDKAKQTITEAGLSVRECHWPDEYQKEGIKGIDDLLLYRLRKKKGK